MTAGQIARNIGLPLLVFAALAAAAFNQDDLLRQFGMNALSQVAHFLNYGLQVGIWMSGAYLLVRMIRVFIWDGILQDRLGFPVPRLIRDVVAFVVYALAVTSMLSTVFQMSGIWATTGALGLVVGLALRNVILDVFMGLAGQLDRPYRIGDFIMLQTGAVGRVADVRWRTTRLETNEGNTVIIPNSRIGDMVVTNFSVPNTLAEFELTFSLDFTVPSERALRVLTAGAMAVAGTGGILGDPEPPKARIKGVSNTGIEYKVKYWIDCAKVGPGKARHIVLESVLGQLHHSGLELGYTRQDVYYAPMPQRQLDAGSAADRVRLLARTDLFKELSADELEELAAGMQARLMPPRGTLITQADAGDSMFIVFEGMLNVFVDADDEGLPDHLRVGTVTAGGFLGEMSLLTGEPRSATVTAATEALVFEITKPQMGDLLSRRPELIESLSHVAADRHLRTTEAFAKASKVDQEVQKETLASQIMAKVRAFFWGVRGQLDRREVRLPDDAAAKTPV
jgi:small-conductance mechanosensitive channel/CRP-like cAMP-binding protein